MKQSRAIIAVIAPLLSLASIATAAPFDDLKAGIETARKNNGSFIQCRQE